jgi:hypothetical protein
MRFHACADKDVGNFWIDAAANRDVSALDGNAGRNPILASKEGTQ